MDLTKALSSLKPGAQWVMRGNEYSGLEWLDTVHTKPTEAELTAEAARLDAEYIANKYQRDRAEAYPSFADQFDTLYHGGINAWKATIDTVKEQFPKP